jgi:hypothetical protein
MRCRTVCGVSIMVQSEVRFVGRKVSCSAANSVCRGGSAAPTEPVDNRKSDRADVDRRYAASYDVGPRP